MTPSLLMAFSPIGLHPPGDASIALCTALVAAPPSTCPRIRPLCTVYPALVARLQDCKTARLRECKNARFALQSLLLGRRGKQSRCHSKYVPDSTYSLCGWTRSKWLGSSSREIPSGSNSPYTSVATGCAVAAALLAAHANSFGTCPNHMGVVQVSDGPAPEPPFPGPLRGSHRPTLRSAPTPS